MPSVYMDWLYSKNYRNFPTIPRQLQFPKKKILKLIKFKFRSIMHENILKIKSQRYSKNQNTFDHIEDIQ